MLPVDEPALIIDTSSTESSSHRERAETEWHDCKEVPDSTLPVTTPTSSAGSGSGSRSPTLKMIASAKRIARDFMRKQRRLKAVGAALRLQAMLQDPAKVSDMCGFHGSLRRSCAGASVDTVSYLQLSFVP